MKVSAVFVAVCATLATAMPAVRDTNSTSILKTRGINSTNIDVKSRNTPVSAFERATLVARNETTVPIGVVPTRRFRPQKNGKRGFFGPIHNTTLLQ